MKGVLALAGCLLLATAAAWAATGARITAPGPVGALAADGSRVAFVTVRSPQDCDRVRVWNTATRGISKLGRRTHCVATSTGHGIASLALAGRRVLWLHYVGGNLREWTIWTATTTRPLPRKLAAATVEVDASPPLVVGHGDSWRLGTLLPYASGRDVIVLRENGSRAFSWHAPDRVVALATDAGRLVVALVDGRVIELNGPTVVREWKGAPAASAVFVTVDGVVAQRGRTVQYYGTAARGSQLPAGTKLLDAEVGRGVYVARGFVHVVDLVTGADRVAAPGTQAQLEGNRLVVALGRTIRVLRAA